MLLVANKIEVLIRRGILITLSLRCFYEYFVLPYDQQFLLNASVGLSANNPI